MMNHKFIQASLDFFRKEAIRADVNVEIFMYVDKNAYHVIWTSKDPSPLFVHGLSIPPIIIFGAYYIHHAQMIFLGPEMYS